jgi:8-oxo-dGTP diphosphatase
MPIPVVCAIIIRDNHILLAQRPEGKHLALKWEFPGGKVEPGEEPAAALIRELREEMGCTVDIVAALPRSEHSYDRGTIEMIPFVCALNANIAEPAAHEHAAIAWVTLDQIEGFDLAPADWPVVEALKKGWGQSTLR